VDDHQCGSNITKIKIKNTPHEISNVYLFIYLFLVAKFHNWATTEYSLQRVQFFLLLKAPYFERKGLKSPYLENTPEKKQDSNFSCLTSSQILVDDCESSQNWKIKNP
jgi:hypothetical protein